MTTSHHNKDIDRFDRWASHYEESWMQRTLFEPAHRTTLELAATLVSKPESVLDVGCGTGKLLRQASTVWPQAHLTGVDPAEGMIEIAQRQTPDATFLTGMAEALPLQDASVELALSTISFHHWQDQSAGIREIVRVLRPGGTFILVDFSFPTWMLQIVRLKRVHSPAQFQVLFRQAGLRVKRQQPLGWRRWLATVGTK